jgi:Tfp pilus assembly protein PilN
MIEINLLPGGARKKATVTRSSVDFAALTAGLAKFGSPYVIGAAVAGLLAIGGVGFMYLKQSSDRKTAESRLITGLDDSTRYANIVLERVRLAAKRDTLLRQVNLIHSIDEDRYVWPHILDEVSRALPNYTWITNLQFAGSPAGATNVVALPKAPPPPPRDTSSKVPAPTTKPKVPAMPTAIPKDEVTVRVTGRTVDIQALTRFMRDLSQSPFLSDVSVERADPGSDQGKEIYLFTLSMKFRRPDSTALHRVPLVVTVR